MDFSCGEQVKGGEQDLRMTGASSCRDVDYVYRSTVL